MGENDLKDRNDKKPDKIAASSSTANTTQPDNSTQSADTTTKPKRKTTRRTFRSALKKELAEHRSSFIVFTILRLLVIFVIVRQTLRGDYESVFYGVLALVLLYVPSLVQISFHIELPPALEISILCFIFAAEILGEIQAYYLIFPHWDTMLHTINGFLAAAVGFSMVVLLNDNEKLTFNLSPIFMAMLAFCFSMTIGVLWEFFEFGYDQLFFGDTQKDTIIHAIHSVELDPTRSNKTISITDIDSVIINGQELGVGGYLDIGLIDTMEDLIVNFIGALVFSIIGFLFVKNQGKGKTRFTQYLLPKRKTKDTDYLEQANESAYLEQEEAAASSNKQSRLLRTTDE